MFLQFILHAITFTSIHPDWLVEVCSIFSSNVVAQRANVNPTNGKSLPVKPRVFFNEETKSAESSSLGSNFSKYDISSGPLIAGTKGGITER